MKRDRSIDIAKGCAIMLVCLGHTGAASVVPLNSWICSFHMAFFFLVAGYCYNPNRYKNYSEYAIRKIKALGWPYLMLSLFVAVASLILIPDSSLSAMLSYVLPYPGKRVIGFWFVRVLFFTELISAICKFRPCRLLLFVISLLGVLLIGYGQVGNSPEIVRPASIIMGIFFYHVGMVAREVVNKLNLFARCYYAVGAILLFSVQIAILWLAGWPQFSFGGAAVHDEPFIFMFTALSGSVALVFAARFVDSIPAIRSCLEYLGRNSLCLLAVHPICGVARSSWIAQYPQITVSISYFIELLVIVFCMWLLSGPLGFLSKWIWK